MIKNKYNYKEICLPISCLSLFYYRFCILNAGFVYTNNVLFGRVNILKETKSFTKRMSS